MLACCDLVRDEPAAEIVDEARGVRGDPRNAQHPLDAVDFIESFF